MIMVKRLRKNDFKNSDVESAFIKRGSMPERTNREKFHLRCVEESRRDPTRFRRPVVLYGIARESAFS